MKQFLSKILVFVLIFILFITFILVLPATPRASRSFIFSQITKDSLLKHVKPPRILFIGGSTLTFGLSCGMVKDSLGLNPINTAITAPIGLIFMMDNTLEYVRQGDIVVVVPEYPHFYGNFSYGNEVLLRILVDVSPGSIAKTRLKQWRNIYRFIPKVVFSKLKPTEYFNVQENRLYSVGSFNEYGDVYTHWGLPNEYVPPETGAVKEEFNDEIVEELLIFRNKLEKLGARLFIGFPGLQATTYDNFETTIDQVHSKLNETDLVLLGTPKRYRMSDSLIFNTPYHLNKQGTDLRTAMLIEDIKRKI